MGGFFEKVTAAQEAGAKLVVIGRTTEEQGESYEEILKYLRENFVG